MRYVLDSFALLAYFGDEEGADVVENIFNMAKKGEANVYMSYVNLGEVYYIIYREEGVDKANETLALIKRLPIEFVEVNDKIALTAARVKATHRLSYADAYVVATAIDRDAEWLLVIPNSEMLMSRFFGFDNQVIKLYD
ncbi:MAG: PIN domain nuclease [Archaeoglobales archaeon]|nr:MAG: PIN domain nuclease [Archaeoglobales archaeon]